ncbi:thioredoxin domain-containing protein 17-like [Echinops telfairi]|uniref:Thioredoxin domain-containing protein 17-like n=1 Tax=Echinops telfairi TaxID=9371 RepID=A0AC55CW27_ECHTE|nr:thioredoxin domain-containing protein 17-like [Echinops telfairi]
MSQNQLMAMSDQIIPVCIFKRCHTFSRWFRYVDVRVSGFEEFNQAVEQHKSKTIFAEGKSWCPDCELAEPVVLEGLKHTGEGCVFIYCQVGERPYWKDPNNDFRKELKVTAVPTLLKYGKPQKLVESECLQASLVEMIFSEE